jgi:signal transduction histidine kinase/CheY-like chemotaxis protein
VRVTASTANILALCSFLLGAALLCWGLFFAPSAAAHVYGLAGSVGWILVGLLVMREKKIYSTIADASKLIGLSEPQGAFTRLVESFAYEFTRFIRSITAFQGNLSSGAKDLGESLRKIAKMVYVELHANAVEMSLFDEGSHQWSQGMVIGAPRSMNSQAMMAAAAEARERQILSYDNYQVLVMPVILAGKVFGAIRVEIPGAQRPSQNDIELLHLFAVQGALALVDARFTDELLRMRRASEETVRAKTGFLANLSHELRGPLGIILNGVELIRDGLCGSVSEQQQSTLKMIKDSGDHLLDLVNDVLDYAKVEAGKIIPKPVQIPVKDLVEDLAAVVRTQAVEKGHVLDVQPVDPALGMLCDKRHARQMLINFLTNAVKYTPNGGRITLSAARVSGNRVKISVADTGIGIPENQKSKVFAAFERVDDKYALSQMGTGLGMPLTRRLAEVNGGAADFDSTVGEGSTFWLMMPAVEIEAPALSLPASGEDSKLAPQGQGEAILLIDHDASTRQMLGTYLQSQGFDIFQAKSGGEVLKILRDTPVELAVVESDMPDLPGEEMVAAIRSMPNAASVPIILLSSKAFVFDIERFLKLGVDRCLSKPVTLSEVAITARRLIDEARNI